MDIKFDKNWQQQNGKYKCPMCGKEYTNKGIMTHIWRKHTEEGKDFTKNHDPNIGYKNGTRVVWNKGLTKDIDKRVEAHGKSISKSLSGKKRKPLSKEHKEKISKTLAENNSHNGGYIKVPYIDYLLKNGKTIKLRGTYEVRFATYLDKNNIEWEYQNSIPYYDDGQLRHLLPDFYIPTIDKYFDTKGYLTEDYKHKMQLVKEQTGIDINLIYLKDIEMLENNSLQIIEFSI